MQNVSKFFTRGQGRGAGAQVRQRARVREPPGRADRRGRRSGGGRGRHRDARRCTCSPCTRPRGSSGRSCSWWTACRTGSRPPGGSDPLEMPRRAHQGHPAHRRLPRAGGAPPLLRGHDPRQGAALPHERGGHGRQAQVEGEPVRAGGARPAQGRGAALPGAGHRGAAAAGAAARSRPASALAPIADDEPLAVSHRQVDDYETCPLKYQYIHILRIPLRQHHAVVYGSALHKAVEFYLRRRAAGNYTSLEDFLRAFDDAWRNEGFLTREHEEQRKRAGVAALTRFYHEEEASGQKPTDVEREFGFNLGLDRVRGRFDRVDETPRGPRHRRLQVERRHRPEEGRPARAREPPAQDLRAGLARDDGPAARAGGAALPRVGPRRAPHADARPTWSTAREAIEAAARGIRQRSSRRRPTYQVCRYCPYNQICPSTATQE